MREDAPGQDHPHLRCNNQDEDKGGGVAGVL